MNEDKARDVAVIDITEVIEKMITEYEALVTMSDEYTYRVLGSLEALGKLKDKIQEMKISQGAYVYR